MKLPKKCDNAECECQNPTTWLVKSNLGDKVVVVKTYVDLCNMMNAHRRRSIWRYGEWQIDMKHVYAVIKKERDDNGN